MQCVDVVHGTLQCLPHYLKNLTFLSPVNHLRLSQNPNMSQLNRTQGSASARSIVSNSRRRPMRHSVTGDEVDMVDVVTLGPGSNNRHHRGRGRRRGSRYHSRRQRRRPSRKKPALPEIPQDLWNRVLTFLDPRTLLQVQTVCKAWRDAISGDGCGVLWHDAIVRDMALPKTKRLAYPKKAFQKLEASGTSEGYRDYALVSILRSCPVCKKALELCYTCGYASCIRCGWFQEDLPLDEVVRLVHRFELPKWECDVCNSGFDDMYLDYFELHQEFIDDDWNHFEMLQAVEEDWEDMLDYIEPGTDQRDLQDLIEMIHPIVDEEIELLEMFHQDDYEEEDSAQPDTNV